MTVREVKINSEIIVGGNNPPVLIAGPCVIEDEKITLAVARELKSICAGVEIPLIFKSSYDKANRSSISSYRGPGLKKGLKILRRIKEKTGVPVLSDVHRPEEVRAAAEVLDVLQIPAFLCRQTDLLLAAARTGRPVNVKKGQFLAPEDVRNVVAKIESAGNHNILLTERGSCFGYHNLVVDFRSLPVMRKCGYPVIFDASHSVQLPAGKGTSSGGQGQFIPGLVRAAAAMGCDGLFIEVHPHPEKAPCDGPNMLPLRQLRKLLLQFKEIDRIGKG